MEILKVENGFVLIEDGFEAGNCVLVQESEKLYSIIHVFVDPKFRGKGFASILVKACVDWAKQNNILLAPVCPFAQSEFDKIKEYQSLLPKE